MRRRRMTMMMREKWIYLVARANPAAIKTLTMMTTIMMMNALP
jgi:hypothetical protein